MRVALLVTALLSCNLAVLQAADDIDDTRNAFVATHDPFNETVSKVVYLSQNWTPTESNRFYFTPQGSQIIPYDWFLALEQADSTTPFRDNQNILKFRYLPQNPGPLNPDGLPVGFVADQAVDRVWLGMTCAACHTAEIRYGDKGYRVDGAPTHADVQAFIAELAGAMKQTLDDQAKFERFAGKVLRNHNSPFNQNRLKTMIQVSIKVREGYNLRNFPGYDPTPTIHPAPTNYGRLDAVGAIVNEVYHFAEKSPDLDQPTRTSKLANAPASYPCLWDTPQHDYVQWLGVAKNGGILNVGTLGRNAGEVIGVFAHVEIPDEPSLLSFGYRSSVKAAELGELEKLLESLWSPQWPDDFPPIDKAEAAKGEQIFVSEKCNDCHKPLVRDSPSRKVVAQMKFTGTDPLLSNNFFHRTGPSGKLQGGNAKFNPFGAKIPATADADTMLSTMVVGTILGQLKGEPPDELSDLNFHGSNLAGMALTAIGQTVKYKARPLNGIWATAPYLHNGAIPNLDSLFLPVDKRPPSFSIGTRTFDAVRVGYSTDAPGFPKFNVNQPDGTPIPGNSNAGHVYGTGLSDAERKQLVEHLKTL